MMYLEAVSLVRFGYKIIIIANFIWLTRIMHQPPFLAHEEGMRGGDAEIIHRLHARHNAAGLHHAIGAVEARHVLAHAQVDGVHPAALAGEERVLRRGLQRLAAQRQQHNRRVGVVDGGGDRVGAGGVHGLVIRQHQRAGNDRADGMKTTRGGSKDLLRSTRLLSAMPTTEPARTTPTLI